MWKLYTKKYEIAFYLYTSQPFLVNIIKIAKKSLAFLGNIRYARCKNPCNQLSLNVIVSSVALQCKGAMVMKFGYFDDARREYVVTTPATPLPWINYLGSEDFLGMNSNTGGG